MKTLNYFVRVNHATNLEAVPKVKQGFTMKGFATFHGAFRYAKNRAADLEDVCGSYLIEIHFPDSDVFDWETLFVSSNYYKEFMKHNEFLSKGMEV